VNKQGRPAHGELAAPSSEEAFKRLAAYGLVATVLTSCEEPRAKPLSLEEAAELASQVADLTKAGVPLAAGLRALAEEAPRSRLARVLPGIAQRIEQGNSLEHAVECYAGQLPGHVRRMLAAGHRSGKLASVLAGLVELERTRADLRRRMWRTLAYPTLLLLMLVGLYLFLNTFVVPHFIAIYADFGARVPGMTKLALSAFAPGMSGQVAAAGLLVVLLFYLCTAGRPNWAQTVLYGIPIVGSVWQWSRLAEFSRLMELLLGHETPLPEAFRLTAGALDEMDLAGACQKAADEVEKGGALVEVMATLRPFPPALRPLVQWGQQSSTLADAFRTATELFEGRARIMADLLDTFLPPILFLLILGLFGVLVSGLILPMISLIGTLTGP